MPWEFTEAHVRPNIYNYSPKAHHERQELQLRRKEARHNYKSALVITQHLTDTIARKTDQAWRTAETYHTRQL